MSVDTNTMKAMIEAECAYISDMLYQKNLKYQNSVLSSSGVFSKLDPIERINVRMEDKLSRLQNGLADDEDAEMDLAGYLILKRVVSKIIANEGREVVQKDEPVEAKPEPKKRAARKKKVEAPVEEPMPEPLAEEEAIEPVAESADLVEVSAEDLLGALGGAAEEAPTETISDDGMLGLL